MWEFKASGLIKTLMLGPQFDYSHSFQLAFGQDYIYFSDLLLLHLDRALNDVMYDIAPGLVLCSKFQLCSRGITKVNPGGEAQIPNY